MAEAEEDKADTVRKHEVELKESGLEDISTDAEKALMNTLDALNKNADFQEAVIGNMLDQVKGDYKDTYNNLNNIVKEHGIVVSDTFDEMIKKTAQFKTEWVGAFNPDKAISKENGGPLDLWSKGTDKIINGIVGKNNDSNGAGGQEEIPKYTLTLDKHSLWMVVGIGDSYQLKATVKPSPKDKTIKWMSSDEKVVKVKDGKVMVRGVGKAKITAACAYQDASDTCDVRVVTNKAYQGIKDKDLTDKEKRQAYKDYYNSHKEYEGTFENDKGGTKPPADKDNQNPSGGNDIWKGIEKDASNKGNQRLDINNSIRDRISYAGYKTGYTSQKQLYANLGGEKKYGAYKGTASQNSWMLSQLKSMGYAKGGMLSKKNGLPIISARYKEMFGGDDTVFLGQEGEHVLTTQTTKDLNMLLPDAMGTIASMKTMLGNPSAYAERMVNGGNTQSSNMEMNMYGTLLNIEGNVDREVMDDLERLILSDRIANKLFEKFSKHTYRDWRKLQ